MFSVELAQQELCREPLRHKVGHAVAIIAIEDPIQEAVVFTSSRGRAGGRLKQEHAGGGGSRKGTGEGLKAEKASGTHRSPRTVAIISLQKWPAC